MGTGYDPNLQKLLNTILNSFIELCACDGGSIYTVHTDVSGKRTLKFAAMVTRSIQLQEVPTHLRELSFAFDESSLVGKTAIQRQCFQVSYQSEAQKKESEGTSVSEKTSRKVQSTSLQDGSKKVDSILHYVTRNLLSAPLISPRGELVGVCQLLNKNAYGDQTHPEFDDRDIRLFSIVSGQAALAIENSLLLQEQEKLIEGFVNACVTAVEARDPTTSGHSTRVAEYTVALADAVTRNKSGPLRLIQFNDSQMREIRFAAMLHDIGKISVRESVLMKEKKLFPWELEMIQMRLKLMKAQARLLPALAETERKSWMSRISEAQRLILEANQPSVLPAEVGHLIRELQNLELITDEGESLRALTEEEGYRLSIMKGSLTPDERLEIERHVSHTYEILKLVPWSRGLENVPEIAYRHHEKLDGSGYPLRVGQNRIPVQSRMLTICDIFDALTADDRPYKKALPMDRALDILQMDVGQGKLDAALFEIFVDAKIYEAVETPARRKKAA